MESYLKICIKTSSTDESEIMIAALSEIEFYAFEQEENLLNAYIKSEDFDENKLKETVSETNCYSKEIIQKENWNLQWENSIEPVVIHNFAAIRPSFSKPINTVKYDLVITPKMSFGTGHHATTFLMIEAMENIDFKNKRVIDFGTGTGVLAILAEKCGAKKITAIDNDEWSINNAFENIDVNNCKNIIIEKRNDVSEMEPADIILANINLNVLAEAALSLSHLLKPGALLLISGFLVEDQNEMQNIFGAKSVFKKERYQKNGWMAILFQRM
jgi:ribosomal protein L11 methyltransferase